jgi:hypothetical protein
MLTNGSELTQLTSEKVEAKIGVWGEFVPSIQWMLKEIQGCTNSSKSFSANNVVLRHHCLRPVLVNKLECVLTALSDKYSDSFYMRLPNNDCFQITGR